MASEDVNGNVVLKWRDNSGGFGNWHRVVKARAGDEWVLIHQMKRVDSWRTKDTWEARTEPTATPTDGDGGDADA